MARQPITKFCALSLSLALVACGSATGLGHRPPSATSDGSRGTLRLIATGATANSAFHEATRVFSLGDAGFVVGAPTQAQFFGWDGRSRGVVTLARFSSLAGATSDGRIVVVEPGGAVFALAADGSSMPRTDIDGSRGARGLLSPNEATFASLRGVALEVAPAIGGQPRRLAWVGDRRAAFAWAPDMARVALIDTNAGTTALYVLDVHGRRGTDLMTGDDLADNPGGAVAWRSDHEIVVRRGGGAFADSQIVQVRIGDRGGRVGRLVTLADVPGSVSSIAAHGDRLAVVSVTSHRDLVVAPLRGGALGTRSPIADGDYVRPLGMLSGGRAALVARDEPGRSWVVQIAHEGTTDVVTRLAETAEVVACTDGDERLVLLRDRGTARAELVVFSDGSERVVNVRPALRARLRRVEAMACSGTTCVLRSRSIHGRTGTLLDVLDLVTGIERTPSCSLRGVFGVSTGVALAADGTHAVLAGSTVDVDHLPALRRDRDALSRVIQSASLVDLTACTARVWSVPGMWVEYAQPYGDAMVVSGQQVGADTWGTDEWGLWRVGADGLRHVLAVAPDRIYRPLVSRDGASLFFGLHHVAAAVYVWAPPGS